MELSVLLRVSSHELIGDTIHSQGLQVDNYSEISQACSAGEFNCVDDRGKPFTHNNVKNEFAVFLFLGSLEHPEVRCRCRFYLRIRAVRQFVHPEIQIFYHWEHLCSGAPLDRPLCKCALAVRWLAWLGICLAVHGMILPGRIDWSDFTWSCEILSQIWDDVCRWFVQSGAPQGERYKCSSGNEFCYTDWVDWTWSIPLSRTKSKIFKFANWQLTNNKPECESCNSPSVWYGGKGDCPNYCNQSLIHACVYAACLLLLRWSEWYAREVQGDERLFEEQQDSQGARPLQKLSNMLCAVTKISACMTEHTE